MRSHDHKVHFVWIELDWVGWSEICYNSSLFSLLNILAKNLKGFLLLFVFGSMADILVCSIDTIVGAAGLAGITRGSKLAPTPVYLAMDHVARQTVKLSMKSCA
mmetsp:Transcript_1887/g.2546  ORF Transcript_1887/g.2546 Transcript_1887/m.2546 type:complete len:104 (-) Transcript_1887:203-514(-)